MRLVSILALASLTGCATPAGKFTESDFVWSERSIPITLSAANYNLVKGFRSCSRVDVGHEDCLRAPDDSIVECDVYAGLAFTGDRSQIVIGRIEIKSQGDSVLVRSGKAIRMVTDTKVSKRWIDFAEGQTCASD